MKKEELVKGLTELINEHIEKNHRYMGIRCETENMKYLERSKAVRAYIVDIFGNYEEVEGLHELEASIDESISMYYTNEKGE